MVEFKPFKIISKVNGNTVELGVNPGRRLIDILREDLGLTGTKEGCGEGECGACTVLINGRPVNACLVLAPEMNGKEIITIEGLTKEDELHPIQEAFLEAGAVQCGFCTPGMILTAKALLDKNRDPDEKAVKTAISGNLCRCTGYVKIAEAIRLAALKLAAREGSI